jgi:hypothetical protein
VSVVAIRHQYRSDNLTRPVITCQSSSCYAVAAGFLGRCEYSDAIAILLTGEEVTADNILPAVGADEYEQDASDCESIHHRRSMAVSGSVSVSRGKPRHQSRARRGIFPCL